MIKSKLFTERNLRLGGLAASIAVVAVGLTLVDYGPLRAGLARLTRPAPETRLVVEPLARRLVDTTGVPARSAYQKPYRFRTDWFSRHVPVWETCLAGLKGKPGVRYLEVGLFEGRSALWMLENVLTDPTSRLTGIDLFPKQYKYAKQEDDYKAVFFENLKMSGLEGKATIIEGYSQVELRKLPLGSFDVIYIDGSHDPADCLEDAVLAWRLLKEGGFLILDDYQLGNHVTERPDRGIDAFMHFYGPRFDTVNVDWQVVLRRKAAPAGRARGGE